MKYRDDTNELFQLRNIKNEECSLGEAKNVCESFIKNY